MGKRPVILVLLSLCIPVLVGGAGPKGNASRRFSAPASFTKGLGDVYERYRLVVDGLSQGNVSMAKFALSSMHGALHGVFPEGLDSAGSAFWDSSNARIMAVLHAPAASSDSLAELRKVFAEFTNLLIEDMESFGATTSLPVFVFRCKAGKGMGGYWLQSDKTPANPYFGSKNTACGDFIREMKL